MEPAREILVAPLTADLWHDLVALFGPDGAYGGCWCMWFRERGVDYARNRGDGNRRALESLVEAGTVPGLVGYIDAEPVGWVSVAPATQYAARFDRWRPESLTDIRVWAIVCFFVADEHRRSGVSTALLRAAIAHARDAGAAALEAFPAGPEHARRSPSGLHTGVASMYEAAGFRPVDGSVAGRPVMRLEL